MRSRLYVVLALACWLAMSACDFQWGDTTGPSQSQTVVIGQPSPSPTVAPTASPTATCTGVAAVRVGPFAIECPAGVTPPSNSSGSLPVGCVATVTATPKDASGVDVPASIHGTGIVWALDAGAGVVTVASAGDEAFNRSVTGVKAGDFSLRATVCGVSGAWQGVVR